jgi:hypothetical protein
MNNLDKTGIINAYIIVVVIDIYGLLVKGYSLSSEKWFKERKVSGLKKLHAFPY